MTRKKPPAEPATAVTQEEVTGALVKAIRSRLNLRQQSVAPWMDISQAGLCRLEAGRNAWSLFRLRSFVETHLEGGMVRFFRMQELLEKWLLERGVQVVRRRNATEARPQKGFLVPLARSAVASIPKGE